MSAAICIETNIERGDFSLAVKLQIPVKGLSAIYGPSGCGKTTLLRLIAGLEKHDKTRVQIGSSVWQSQQQFIPVHRRKVGVVFQEASLFSHLSVQDNLLYGRSRLGCPRPDLWQQVLHWLELEPLFSRRVEQLSGGERQRVALGRAILREPELLLLDEPMASLDTARKAEVLAILQRLKSELDLPMILVSHDLQEIAQVADHLVIMQSGKIIRDGNPFQLINGLLSRPDDCLPAFSLLAGESIQADSQYPLWRVRVGEEVITIPAQSGPIAKRIRLQIMARDVSLSLSAANDTSILNILPCRVEKIESFAELGQALVYLQGKGFQLKAQISTLSLGRLELKPGKSVFAQIKAVSVLP